MSKQHKTLVPKLRFPEFRDVGEWAKQRLGEICDYWNGGSHEQAITEKGDYFLISLNSIDIEGELKSDMKRLPYTDNSLKRNDLVMVLSDVAHGNFLGLTDIIPDNYFVLNQRMAGLRLKDLSSVNIRFLRTYINYNQKYFKQRGQGSSQLNLSKSSVTDFPVCVPFLKEQQKIADCLSSVDEVITAQAQKIESLKTHKKGLMQQLFPTEGETAPKLRFPDFRDVGAWEEKRLGDVADITIGEFVIKTRQNPTAQYPVYNGGKSNTGFYDEFNNEGNKIIISARGANAGFVNFETGRYWAGNSCYSVGVRDKNLYNVTFYFYYIKHFENRFTDYQQAANIPSVLKKDVSIFKIVCPSLEEQQKIADCLSSIDEIIATHTRKIEALKAHKKGLMQQLFFNIEWSY